MKLKVWRSGKDGKDARYETYDVRTKPGMSVLEALFAIQDEFDDSLGFRYSCRGAVCGSCAMTINREPRLACRTQVAKVAGMKRLGLKEFPGLDRSEPWAADAEIIVEPLPNLRIERDLIVDMTWFYEAYRKMNPWLDTSEEEKGFSKMLPEEVTNLEKFANCILCAACYGACPVCEKDRAYVGPAALAWSYRFLGDPRESRKADKLSAAGEKSGALGCEFIYNCVKVCPKNVAPAMAIRKLRDQLDRRV